MKNSDGSWALCFATMAQTNKRSYPRETAVSKSPYIECDKAIALNDWHQMRTNVYALFASCSHCPLLVACGTCFRAVADAISELLASLLAYWSMLFDLCTAISGMLLTLDLERKHRHRLNFRHRRRT